MIIIDTFLKIKSVKKAIYFLTALKYTYYEVHAFKNLLETEGYCDVLRCAINDIEDEINRSESNIRDVLDFFDKEEPYFFYLYEYADDDLHLLILAYLMRKFDFTEIFTIPLESIPQFCDDKYKIVTMDDTCRINHQGVFLRNRFYYYNPIIMGRRDAKEPPPLLNLMASLKEKGAEISLRIDESISVDKNLYLPIYREFFEVYHGREINLDKIEFPINKGTSETLCVFNPKTMKKIQFNLSYRKDCERWIEVEELWNYNNDKKNNKYVTRYLHSIYNPNTNYFHHIDGSINIYSVDDYEVRVSKTINSHATSHHKLWLVEGEIDILEWGKLILEYFEDDNLVLDAFKGNLIAEEFLNTL